MIASFGIGVVTTLIGAFAVWLTSDSTSNRSGFVSGAGIALVVIGVLAMASA